MPNTEWRAIHAMNQAAWAGPEPSLYGGVRSLSRVTLGAASRIQAAMPQDRTDAVFGG